MENENILIFDTETTGLIKPFNYNTGYIIVNTTTGVILEKKDFVTEQVWHNLPLFSTAYYAEKRPLYISRMKGKKTKMAKYGYICQELIRDIKKYNINIAFAFNSDFDERVFNFNCDWFKCINPFDNVEIKDIRGFAHKYIVNENYKRFCNKYELFTDSGNYSTTAENVFRYITQNIDFTEEHTALSDSLIEWEILKYCLYKGGKVEENLKAKKSIEREKEKTLTVIGKEKKYTFKCKGYTVYKSKDTIKLK